MNDAAAFLAPFLQRLGARCAVTEVAAAGLPPPHRALLDHGAGMTGTLAERWGGPIQVHRFAQWEEVLAAGTGGGGRTLARLVGLHVAGAGGTVIAAVAAIRVRLDALPASVHAGMTGGDTAFGRLLDEAGVIHHAEPLAFVRAVADGPLAAAAGIGAGGLLYGRYGSLRGGDGRLLCHALELLPRA